MSSTQCQSVSVIRIPRFSALLAIGSLLFPVAGFGQVFGDVERPQVPRMADDFEGVVRPAKEELSPVDAIGQEKEKVGKEGADSNSAYASRLMAEQQPLLVAADRLAEVLLELRPTPSMLESAHGPDGFGAIELDVPGRRVRLFWKTGVVIPAKVREAIEKLRESVRIDVDASPLSERDLLAEQVALALKEA
jgi:hypothetical protein